MKKEKKQTNKYFINKNKHIFEKGSSNMTEDIFDMKRRYKSKITKPSEGFMVKT